MSASEMMMLEEELAELRADCAESAVKLTCRA